MMRNRVIIPKSAQRFSNKMMRKKDPMDQTRR
jgi:hypothetical protein